MSATNLNIRTDKDVKEQAEQLFAELGLNMTTAINLFLRTAIRKHGIPFDLYLDVPNETTVAAIEEGIPVWKNSRQHWNHEIRCKIYLSVQERFEACQKAEQKYR